MLSSQDEACKFLVRSEMISYHSVNGNSFFFSTIFPEERLERYYFYDVSERPFTKKLFFFSEGIIFGILMWRLILVILGHVWPSFVILGMIMNPQFNI